MTQVSLSHTDDRSLDPNWGYNEFLYDKWDGEMRKYGKKNDEYKAEGEHSKKVYDWEILDLFFRLHNLNPYFSYDMYKLAKVKMNLK